MRSKKNMTRERLLLAAADGKSTNPLEKSTEFVPQEALFKPPSSSTPTAGRTPVKLKIEGIVIAFLGTSSKIPLVGGPVMLTSMIVLFKKNYKNK